MVRRRSTKKPLVYLTAAVIVLAAVGWSYFWFTRSDQEDITNLNDINYSPPTEEEAKAGDQIKEFVVERDQTDSVPDGDTKTSTTVIITDAGQYGDKIEVRAFMPEIFEDGRCVITFTKDDLAVSKETPAYKDARSTNCTNPEINVSEFPTKGVWGVKVSYSSEYSRGESETRQLEVK